MASFMLTLPGGGKLTQGGSSRPRLLLQKLTRSAASVAKSSRGNLIADDDSVATRTRDVRVRSAPTATAMDVR